MPPKTALNQTELAASQKRRNSNGENSELDLSFLAQQSLFSHEESNFDNKIKTLAISTKDYLSAQSGNTETPYFPFSDLRRLISEIYATPKDATQATHLSMLLENVLYPLVQWHPKLNQTISGIKEAIDEITTPSPDEITTTSPKFF